MVDHDREQALLKFDYLIALKPSRVFFQYIASE